MKKYKGMKNTLIILVIILLSIISFIGIYVQDKNQIKNVMPEYLLSRELKGHRRIELKVSDEIKETIKYDSEGNVISDESTETAVSRTEEKKVNDSEILNDENYEKCKEILEKRLNGMQVSDHIIRKNKANGTIILELPEDSNTDKIVGQLTLQGKFEIVDNETNEVLMTNNDLKSVIAGYGNTSSGTTAIFININFNKEGTEKFRNITNTYVQTIAQKEENEILNEVIIEETEENTETINKEIAIKIDGTKLLTTHFDTEISNGTLQLSVGSSSNATNEEMKKYLLEATYMAALLDSGEMPIVYEVEQNKYILSSITTYEMAIIVSIVIGILTIGMIYFIIKYKAKGILGSLSLIGGIAILLIALRIFNVEISIGSLVGIILSIAINYCMIFSILKQQEIMVVIKKYVFALIPTLIIAVVFTFMNLAIGSVIFWGIIIAILYNLSITNMLIKD